VTDALRKRKTYLSKELEFSDGRCLGVSTSILRDKRGGTRGVAVLFRDITELKRLEREVSFKEKMAALGEMSAGIAHEFRNSLASILGYGKLLRRRAKDESQTPYIESLIDECMSMETTIRRFLDFARPEEIEIEEFDLTRVLKEVFKHFSKQAARMEISLRASLPDDPIVVGGDPELLKRAILNVVQNAVEATPKGGDVELVLSETKRGVHLVVKDAGVGIDSETRDQAFTPFFTTKKSGTGLGLSIVQKIVAAHKGSVSLKSAVGSGTKVTIDLPRLLPLSNSCVTQR
jgi:signal transduction histidine kinase